MSRDEAKAVAVANWKARRQADYENLFRGGWPVDNEKYGYRHGWYLAGGHSFRDDELFEAVHGYAPRTYDGD